MAIIKLWYNVGSKMRMSSNPKNIPNPKQTQKLSPLLGTFVRKDITHHRE